MEHGFSDISHFFYSKNNSLEFQKSLTSLELDLMDILSHECSSNANSLVFFNPVSPHPRIRLVVFSSRMN